MRKAPTRSKSITAAEGARESVTNLRSVQSLQGDGHGGDGQGGSGVYIVERESAETDGAEREIAERVERKPASARATNVHERAKRAMNPLLEQVTLVVYGWKSVEPGTLSWVFPSVSAAVAAARTMKNAVRWAILAGRQARASDDAADEDEVAKPDEALDEARANGSVLVEQAG
jgi:hypothetical protein